MKNDEIKNDYAVNFFLAAVDIITYLFLILFIIFYGYTRYKEYGIRGIVKWGVMGIALLFMSALFAFVLSKLFPDRRSKQFSALFNCTEGSIILIVFLAALELTDKLRGRLILWDSWSVTSLSKILSENNNIFVLKPQVAITVIKNPGVYALSRLYSVIGKFIELNDDVYRTCNIVVFLLLAFLVYRTVRLLSGRVPAVLVFVLSTLMPLSLSISNMLLPSLYASMLCFAGIYVFTLSRRLTRMGKPFNIRLFLVALSGFFLAAASFFQYSAIPVVLAEIIFICFIQRNRSGNNPELVKTRAVSSIILFVVFCSVFFIFTFIKAVDMQLPVWRIFTEAADGIAGEMMPRRTFLMWNFPRWVRGSLYYNTYSECIINYGIMLVLGAFSILSNFIFKDKSYVIFRCYFLSVVIMGILWGLNSQEQCKILFITIIFYASFFDSVYSHLRTKEYLRLQELNKLFDTDNTDNVTEVLTGGTRESLSVDDVVAEWLKKEKIIEEKIAEKEKEKTMVIELPDEDKNLPEGGWLGEENEVITDKIPYDKPGEEINPPKVKLLESPLPLPKKYIRKGIDFDIDVADDDDFDI